MENFITQLNHEMLINYTAVNSAKNPIALQVNKLNANDMNYIIGQYSLFSKNITSFLLKAFYSMTYEGWEFLAQELMQNIREELNEEHCGGDNNRLPHYVLLRKGAEEGGCDIGSVKPSLATKDFIEGINEVMENTNTAYVAGGCYALESSAVPELDMTLRFAHSLFEKLGKPTPEKIVRFFETHIGEIEVAHEARLQEVCLQYITTTQQVAAFQQGFRAVMSVMENWWQGLLHETEVLATAA